MLAGAEQLSLPKAQARRRRSSPTSGQRVCDLRGCKNHKNLRKCTRCRTARYCSKECQSESEQDSFSNPLWLTFFLPVNRRGLAAPQTVLHDGKKLPVPQTQKPAAGWRSNGTFVSGPRASTAPSSVPPSSRWTSTKTPRISTTSGSWSRSTRARTRKPARVSSSSLQR
ncbi:hypothetical protein B0H14DRAFT_1363553 [Mycena olivaceomarginata]|nr:hypothetical protein B0H14DRAFT_1363553 [Mycena olivaceomarginata]